MVAPPLPYLDVQGLIHYFGYEKYRDRCNHQAMRGKGESPFKNMRCQYAALCMGICEYFVSTKHDMSNVTSEMWRQTANR